MFENIDINYIVIGLIVLTLVCIYLLYNSLNSGSDSLELKKHINELVLQNKKRDEIIHFLVNQVQLLQSQPPISTIDTTKQGEHFTNLDDNNTLNGVEETVNVNDILEDVSNDVLGNDVMSNNINVDDMAKLDKILAEDISLVDTEHETMADTEHETMADTENEVDTSNETGQETDTGNETDTDNESQGSQSSDALVDSILANDKLPPKDKNMLNLYTVSQLKDYAKELNLSMTGNKNTLVNRIYDSL